MILTSNITQYGYSGKPWIKRRICNSLKKADCIIMKLVRAGEMKNNDVKKNKDWFQV